MEDICSICGDGLCKQYSHKLNCGHEFHYDCLMKSFKGARNTNCPYCRSLNNLLPLVNGIKKVEYNIIKEQKAKPHKKPKPKNPKVFQNQK